MIFFPYRADVGFNRWPLFTFLVCVICIGVFVQQVWSEHEYRSSLMHFCNYGLSRNEKMLVNYLPTDDKSLCATLLRLRESKDRDGDMRELAEQSKSVPFYRKRSDSEDYIYTSLRDATRRLDREVPRNLTNDLSYDPSTLNVKRMVTAAFTHADVFHLLFNLLFFFAFAASLEVIAGHLLFAGFAIATAIGTHLAYAYSVRNAQDAIPTIGLSGVVMAMMAFLAVIAPTLRIRCFLWLLIIVRRIRVPAMLLVAFYVAENIYDYSHATVDDHVNYIAHISGAVFGAIAGVAYRFTHRAYLSEIVY
ncbi:MAG TPA: rhomboid family intramembrane serine protease [Steroidobacteraceae bacterium]|nr:rhomboid family intramembrane serine protease [Steroidobacteraceae bacterium]